MPRPGAVRRDVLTRLNKTDRSSILVNTALASTLLVGTLFAPAPAVAQTMCTGGPAAGPTPILEFSNSAPIICANNDDRKGTVADPDAINLSTAGADHYIDLYNSGPLTASEDGIDTQTEDDNSFITIENVGDIDAGNTGISAVTEGSADRLRAW